MPNITTEILLLPILSFLLLLTNLIFLSFFGFLRNAGTWIATCVYFFPVNIMISWFVFTLASVDEIAEYAAVHLQRLEDAGKQSANLQTHILALNEFSWIFFQEEDFQVRTALSLFTVNAPRPCQLSSGDMSLPNLHAHVRFGPIVRRVKKPIRNPLISNAQICPCDSAGYQNELLGTNSQTDYNNGLRDTWAGCKAG